MVSSRTARDIPMRGRLAVGPLLACTLAGAILGAYLGYQPPPLTRVRVNAVSDLPESTLATLRQSLEDRPSTGLFASLGAGTWDGSPDGTTSLVFTCRLPGQEVQGQESRLERDGDARVRPLLVERQESLVRNLEQRRHALLASIAPRATRVPTHVLGRELGQRVEALLEVQSELHRAARTQADLEARLSFWKEFSLPLEEPGSVLPGPRTAREAAPDPFKSELRFPGPGDPRPGGDGESSLFDARRPLPSLESEVLRTRGELEGLQARLGLARVQEEALRGEIRATRDRLSEAQKAEHSHEVDREEALAEARSLEQQLLVERDRLARLGLGAPLLAITMETEERKVARQGVIVLLCGVAGLLVGCVAGWALGGIPSRGALPRGPGGSS